MFSQNVGVLKKLNDSEYISISASVSSVDSYNCFLMYFVMNTRIIFD